jgi:hypothetical protein
MWQFSIVKEDVVTTQVQLMEGLKNLCNSDKNGIKMYGVESLR